MQFGVFVVWLLVCGYAVWIACGWSLGTSVSVALISCWQADERAVYPAAAPQVESRFEV